MPRKTLALATATVMTAVSLSSVGTSSSQASAASSVAPTPSKATGVSDGAIALSGDAAAAYRLPPDVRKVWVARYADGTRQTRYQQVVAGADVLGGQVTVFRDAGGTTTSVIGARYATLEPVNALRLTKADARETAIRILGARGARYVDLKLDPRDGRLFYAVETRRPAHRWVQWIDATTGRIDNQFDAVAHGEGEGVKGDHKTIDTTSTGDGWQLVSADGRQLTYDAKNGTAHPGSMMNDPDNTWDFSTPYSVSPSQPAGVDAHYYANVVDDFYGATFQRNSIDDAGMPIVSTVHYDVAYCNAFWNGEQMTYGDGDGPGFLPLSGGLDVVSHELTHGVTDFTSELIYENESGALNEAFSDMMGNSAEFWAEARNLDPTVEPDWLIGEDVIPAGVYGGTTAGFRNMGDPRDDGDPDHYSERYTRHQRQRRGAHEQRHPQPRLLPRRQRR